jgi:nucleotide-binding universal stress UspA family protein
MKLDLILNPIDGSDHSVNATKYAIELAKSFNAKIILLHCHRHFPALMAEPHFQEAINKIMKGCDKLVDPFEEMLEQSGVDYDIRILEGRARDVIPNVAEIEKTDIIVMGSRGVTDFGGLILGSVAHQVLHKADRPVLIVK